LLPATYILWFGPGALLVLGFIAVLFWLRSRRVSTAIDAPLDAQEQNRLDALLHEADR
jgi:cytochrome c-type biogenesis protein CcmH/NrfF